ncbi:MAG: acetate--CoA ligase family protein [Thermodesulfobacteriota bacterium]
MSDIITAALRENRLQLSEHEGKELLKEYGVPVTREHPVWGEEEALEAARGIGYPVVLKVCSPEIIHKTERGLVALGLSNEDDLKRAWRDLTALAGQAPFLVQEMVFGSRELVMGLTRDPQFGPCVMFGLGGIFTEALNDVTFRAAPLEPRDVREMVQEIKGRRILEAIRGLEAVDMDQISRALIGLGRLSLEEPAVREVDVNPVIICGSRPVAVDALVILQSESNTALPEPAPSQAIRPDNSQGL